MLRESTKILRSYSNYSNQEVKACEFVQYVLLCWCVAAVVRVCNVHMYTCMGILIF